MFELSLIYFILCSILPDFWGKIFCMYVQEYVGDKGG